jgi:ferrous iron transport protein B
MIKKIFLVGNPNVGKSVIFSRLTGVQVISSNYPGTTIDIVKGYLKLGDEKIEVIDLPGTYSLEPTSEAERVAVSLLEGSLPEETLIVNTLDATNLERNLYLTLQLIDKGLPIIVCLNMCDDTIHRGICIDETVLQGLLGVPVVSTCAVTGQGIKTLIEKIQGPRSSLEKQERTHQERWLAIGNIVEHVQKLTHRHHTVRERLEDASVHPAGGILIAAAVLFFAFQFVRIVGEGLIQYVFDPLFMYVYQPLLDRLSSFLGESGFVHHVLIGELIHGKIDFKQSLGLLTTAPYIEIAMVLPYIIAFYFVLSLLEDIGFLPRLAMILDTVFHKLGLHGFAIIPVLLGFGCNVPGILATRILESKRERFIAATLISIGVPCVPLQAMIIGLLGKFSGFYVAGVYLILLAVWLILGMILNRTVKGYSPEFLLEIPPYRFPPWGLLFKKIVFRIKGFLIEALPVVLIGVLVVNILFFYRVFDGMTNFFAPVMQRLFGLPQEAIVALTIGFVRKDVAAGMLVPLHLNAKQLFISTTLLALSFPCVATFAVLLKELGYRDLLKAFMIMIITGVLVGVVLNISLVNV